MIPVADWVGAELSLAVSPKMYVPADVGVPVSAPLSESVSPGGTDPFASVKWYGVVPPIGCVP